MRIRFHITMGAAAALALVGCVAEDADDGGNVAVLAIWEGAPVAQGGAPSSALDEHAVSIQADGAAPVVSRSDDLMDALWNSMYGADYEVGESSITVASVSDSGMWLLAYDDQRFSELHQGTFLHAAEHGTDSVVYGKLIDDHGNGHLIAMAVAEPAGAGAALEPLLVGTDVDVLRRVVADELTKSASPASQSITLGACYAEAQTLYEEVVADANSKHSSCRHYTITTSFDNISVCGYLPRWYEHICTALVAGTSIAVGLEMCDNDLESDLTMAQQGLQNARANCDQYAIVKPTLIGGYLANACYYDTGYSQHWFDWRNGNSANVSYYDVYYNWGDGGPWYFSARFAGDVHAAFAYVRGGSAYVKVRACDSTGCSPLSDNLYFAGWYCFE